MRFLNLAAALALSFTATSALAQSFEDVLAAAQNDVGEMSKYQQALQNPDPRLQYALVQQMLKLEDPAIQRIAKDHALFSTNPVMREAAIKAILDSGATLRLQVAGEGKEYTYLRNWFTDAGGSLVNGKGGILFKVPPALRSDCWGRDNRCVITHVGNTLQFNPFLGGKMYTYQVSAYVTLGNDGILRGTMNYSNSEVLQMQIDLKE